MFSINADFEKNRLYITLGAVETGDGEKFFEEIRPLLAKMEKGFSCISDISRFSFIDPAEADWVDDGIKMFADAGMTRVVRVTGTEVENRETTEKLGYKVNLAKTVEDAEQILDSL